MKNNYTVIPISYEQTKPFILQIHYAKRMPSISYSFGLYLKSELVGIVTYGSPPSSSICESIAGVENKFNVLELNRLALKYNNKNEASLLVAQSFKLLPKPRIIISFSDTNKGHHGYIYQACNFMYTGKSKETYQFLDENGKEFHHRRIGHEIERLRPLINLEQRIKENLTDDLLKKEYLDIEERNKYLGHCYVASECYYHLSSKKLSVHYIKHEGSTHWFLKDQNNEVIDLTYEQFEKPVPYHNAKRGFFLTKSPSKRTKILIDRVMINPFRIFKRRNNEHELDRIKITNYLRENKGNIKTKDIDESMSYKDCASHWFRLDESGHAYPSVDDWIKLKKILKFDDTFDDLMTRFELVPDSKEIIEKFNLRKEFIKGKHRYIYIIGDKNDKKNLFKQLKYTIQEYPKGNNKRYETDNNIQTQGLLI